MPGVLKKEWFESGARSATLPLSSPVDPLFWQSSLRETASLARSILGDALADLPIPLTRKARILLRCLRLSNVDRIPRVSWDVREFIPRTKITLRHSPYAKYLDQNRDRNDRGNAHLR